MLITIDPPVIPHHLLVVLVITMFAGLYGILPLATSATVGGLVARINPGTPTRAGVTTGAAVAAIAALLSTGMLWLVINHSSHPLVKFLEQWQVLLVGWPALMAFLSTGVTWMIVRRVGRQPHD